MLLRLWLAESRPWRLRLPIAATDPNATAADTHADGDPFAEDPGADNDEHSKLPDPPPRQHRPFN
jgi:hypothetical protein